MPMDRDADRRCTAGWRLAAPLKSVVSHRENGDIVAGCVYGEKPSLICTECQSALRSESRPLTFASRGHATCGSERTARRSIENQNRISGGGIGHGIYSPRSIVRESTLSANQRDG